MTIVVQTLSQKQAETSPKRGAHDIQPVGCKYNERKSGSKPSLDRGSRGASAAAQDKLLSTNKSGMPPSAIK